MLRSIQRKLENTSISVALCLAIGISVLAPLLVGSVLVYMQNNEFQINVYGDSVHRMVSAIEIPKGASVEQAFDIVQKHFVPGSGTACSYYLFAEGSVPVASGCNEGTIFPLELYPEAENMECRFRLHDNRYRGLALYVFAEINLEYSIVVVLAVDSLPSPNQNFMGIVGVVMLLVLAFVSASLLLLWRYYVAPSRILEKTMKNPAMNTEISSYSSWRNEVGTMCASYLERYQEYQDSLEEINRLNIEQRASEIEVLQNQINSHFIYNTLNNIQWLASANRMEDVVRTARSLDILLRACAKNDSDYVTIEDELTYVEAYLSSQKIRFNDIFDYEFQLDPLQMQMKIPKFIIQPIVENSIYHGFLDVNRSNGHIRIRLYRQGYRVIIEVYDNGVGIPEENIFPILNNTQKSSDRYMGIAIGNINKRIKLLCGREFGLGIDSIQGQYTRVKIILPIIP